ncbi:MAG: hypothetical protein LUQ31_08995 [Methanoregula sp.]|nr:hypothetical protein [Methanoregula sp.]
MRKKLAAVIVLFGWLLVVSIFMLLAASFDLEIFFVLWLIGILVIAELLDAGPVHAGYMKYVHFLIAVGIVIFGAIVAQKILEILAK